MQQAQTIPIQARTPIEVYSPRLDFAQTLLLQKNGTKSFSHRTTQPQ